MAQTFNQSNYSEKKCYDQNHQTSLQVKPDQQKCYKFFFFFPIEKHSVQYEQHKKRSEKKLLIKTVDMEKTTTTTNGKKC